MLGSPVIEGQDRSGLAERLDGSPNRCVERRAATPVRQQGQSCEQFCQVIEVMASSSDNDSNQLVPELSI